MSTETVNRRYETRRKTRNEISSLKSRVDWKRTKRDISQVLESEDDDGSSSGEGHSEASVDAADGSSTDGEEEQDLNKPVLQKEEAEEECITPARRKRTSSVLYDHDSSSDEEPVRKVFSKRHCIMDYNSSDGEDGECCSTSQKAASVDLVGEGESSGEKENANTRKRKRLMKLKELSQRRSNLTSDSEHIELSEEETHPFPLTPTGISDQEEDNGSLNSFIVDDEDECGSESGSETQSRGKALPVHQSLFLEHHIPLVSDHFVDFQIIVKAFLINAMDDTFLISLFDGTRQKRYAKEMRASINHLDERIIAPRLENLKSRSRWKEQYKERVESYPCLQIIKHRGVDVACHACGLTRYISCKVILSGESYNSKTLETDDFMPHDLQILEVGSICAERTRVYHQLKHFKYNLHKQCISFAKVAENDEKPVKDTVDMLFAKLEGSWFQREYDILEKYLNEADYFQEEMID